jgi:peptidoglycan/LPS O-acetylase OafA/YrhL
MTLSRHIPQLDVLRGIAVLMVMLSHISGNVPSLHLNPVFRYGWTGVDLFFVLSGFLITGILLRAKSETGYFTNFYVRRALRIWPLYFCLLAFGFLVVPILQPQLRPTVFEQCHPWQTYLVFIQNLVVPKSGTFGPLEITWSLCVEEQFYLVWPLIVLFCSPKSIVKISVAAFFVSLVLRFASAHHWLGIDFYHNTLCRLDGLAMGSLAAIALPNLKEASLRRYAPWIAGVASLGLVASIPLGIAKWAFPAIVSVLFVAVMCLSIAWHRFPQGQFLAFTGRISYGLYLLHILAYDVVRDQHFRKLLALTHNLVINDVIVLVCSLALAYGLALASWKLLESPILSMKRHFEFRQGPAPASSASMPQIATPAA